jgi:O-antigen/teichoic acid export membrane protein
LILEHFAGSRAAGLYAAAGNPIFTLSAVSAVLNSAILLRISRPESMRPGDFRAYEAYCVLLAASGSMAALILFYSAPLLLTLMYGSSFIQSIELFKLLIWWIPISLVTGLFGSLMVAHRREEIIVKIAALNALTNLISNLVLVPRFGATAAAALTLGTELVGFGCYMVALRHDVLALNSSFKTLMLLMLAPLIVFVLPNMGNAASATASSLGIFILVGWVMRLVDPEYIRRCVLALMDGIPANMRTRLFRRIGLAASEETLGGSATRLGRGASD